MKMEHGWNLNRDAALVASIQCATGQANLSTSDPFTSKSQVGRIKLKTPCLSLSDFGAVFIARSLSVAA